MNPEIQKKVELVLRLTGVDFEKALSNPESPQFKKLATRLEDIVSLLFINA